ncbi:MAG: protein kinase [Deltaproteobacteria bacterium]|nr:protein kinase [Deltaproteobacteria bacterium]
MGEPIGGRYTLRERLGSGAFGEVYAAWDELAHEIVAIKLIDFAGDEELTRIRREVAALRLLDDPGVVKLRDDGVHDGRYHLVMDLVTGEPFPGIPTPCAWADIRDSAMMLLSTLARVHEVGIMHRDLKPANILVTASGRPVLIDFGVSDGPSMGATLDEPGSWVGTPQYFTPEQSSDESPPDYRADLYGVGLIIYEALTGTLPHVGGTITELIYGRETKPAPPLSERAPEVPKRVADVVMRLLAIAPKDRPESARAVIAMLVEEGELPLGGVLRWLGSREPVEDAVVALADGTSVAVSGPPGTGRARLIEEIAADLARRGIGVTWLAPGARPFASVAEVVGLGAATHTSLDEARAAVVAGLRARLMEGVVAIRRVQHLDEWSREVLVTLREAGPILSPIEELGRTVVAARRLTESDLRDLFRGPDLLMHYREDGARLLWERTHGHPASIAHEASAWVLAGHANWDEDRRLVVTRQSLDRLVGDVSPAPRWRDWRARPEGDGVGPSWTRRTEALEVMEWLAVAGENVDLQLVAEGLQRPVWEVEALLDDLASSGAIVRDARGLPRIASGFGLAQTWSSTKRQNTHGLVADRLEPGAKARVSHLVAAGRLGDAGREAAVIAAQEIGVGRLGLALVAADAGLVAARADGATDAERDLLSVLVRLACAGGSARGLDEALYQIGVASEDPHVRRLEVLARECRNVCVTPGVAHIEALGRLAPSTIPSSSGGASSIGSAPATRARRASRRGPRRCGGVGRQRPAPSAQPRWSPCGAGRWPTARATTAARSRGCERAAESGHLDRVAALGARASTRARRS